MKIPNGTIGGALRIGQCEARDVGTTETVDQIDLVIQVPRDTGSHSVFTRELVIGADLKLVCVALQTDCRMLIVVKMLGLGLIRASFPIPWLVKVYLQNMVETGRDIFLSALTAVRQSTCGGPLQKGGNGHQDCAKPFSNRNTPEQPRIL
jgi:hypothetical protein